MEPGTSQPVRRFGPFEADFQAGELRKHGIRLHIQEQPLRMLSMLVEHTDQVVSRQELSRDLWPGHEPADLDDSLNATVKKLRDALGDDAGKPLYIETIPRRGYRFIAPVQVDPPAAPPAEPVSPKLFILPTAPQKTDERDAVIANLSAIASPSRDRVRLPSRWSALWLASLTGLIFVCLVLLWTYVPGRMKKAAASGPIRSIAVLPFDNLSGDPNQEYFADGLTDVVITDLAQLGTIRVISRASVMQYKTARKPLDQIRRELDVDAVVEGSVARSGNTIRVNAQLIQAAEDRHLWARSFERDAGDIVALQDDVARSVATSIQAAIGPGSLAHPQNARPVSIEAYEAYLRGLFFLNHRTNADLRKSLEYFNQATDLDTALAPAYAGAAHAYGLLADYDGMSPRDAEPRAEAAARKAIELDDSVSSAHAALAFALWKYDWDWHTSESEFQRALELNPSDANTQHVYGLFLACKGDFESGLNHIRKAQQLDPLSMIIRTNIAWISYYRRDFPKAVAGYQEVLQLDPLFVVAHQKLWIAYALEGNKGQAVEELGNVFRFFGHSELANTIDQTDISSRYSVALQTYVDSGYLTLYEKARYLSLLGKKKEALEALDEAAAQRSSWMIYLGVEPAFDLLRSSPEFRKLSASANVPFEAAPGRPD
jgi:TolB-like protein/DNA-binding winged helix-turn-helix (wHTH) protein/Tfp pilus assembly protein PilF